MTDRTRAIELAKRLDALAKRGVDGEKANAMAMLDAHMRKHGINEDDLMSLELKSYRFLKVPRGSLEKLTAQCIGSCIRGRKVALYRLAGPSGQGFAGWEVQLTAAEHAEACLKIDVMLPLYKKELDMFNTAFYIANKLMGEADPDAAPLSEAEKAEYRRSLATAENIKKANLLKRLT